MFAHALLGGLIRRSGSFLGDHRFKPRNFAAKRAELARLFELAALLLNAEMERLFLELAPTRFQLCDGQLADFLDLHM